MPQDEGFEYGEAPEESRRRNEQAQENWGRNWMPGQERSGSEFDVKPEGFKGSPERIVETVHERFVQHGQIHADQIEVEFTNNMLVLNGYVESPEEKRLAEDLAASVTGATNVDNRLRIRGEKSSYF
jgi:osmotically-inducible protein OsmY